MTTAAKTPAFIWRLTYGLAYCAGVLNFAIVLLFGVGIGYTTGDSVVLSTDDFSGNITLLRYTALTVCFYILGASIGGFCFPKPITQWKYQHSAFFFILALVLVATRFIFSDHLPLLLVAAAIGGAQNGIGLKTDDGNATTTHFSAYMENFGRAVGQALRTKTALDVHQTKHIKSFSCFVLGNATTALAFHMLHADMVYVAAIFYMLFGVISAVSLRSRS